MTASIPSRGKVTRDRWGPARKLFVQYAEKFVNATRYEEASAIADQAAREIEDLFPVEAGDVGWRPIETAPKDGTVILVGHSKAAFDAYWKEDGGNGPGWVDGTTDLYEDMITFSPTHWQPLPSPPLAEGEGK